MGNLCSQESEPQRTIESNLHPKESHLMLRNYQPKQSKNNTVSRNKMPPTPKVQSATLIQVEPIVKQKPSIPQSSSNPSAQKIANTQQLNSKQKQKQQQISSTQINNDEPIKKTSSSKKITESVTKVKISQNSKEIIEKEVVKKQIIESLPQAPIIEVNLQPQEEQTFFQEEIISVTHKRKGSELSQCQSQSSQLSRQVQNDIKKKYLQAVKQEKQEAQLSDFLIIGEIAKGSISKVYRTKRKVTNKEYAMKIVKKADVKRLQLQENSIPQKNDIGIRRCPFIVKIKYLFEKENKLHYILEYVKGQSLEQYLRKNGGTLKLSQVQFIAAQVVLALEYCHHEAKILYLDLDLENIIVNSNGYIKLTDAALTKTFNYETVKSLTFINEHGSLSPEIIEQNEEICEGADLWALGILIYHLLEGRNPFFQVDGNKRKLYDNILNKQQEYVKLNDVEAISLIDSLLMKKTQERLGMRSTSQLKQHSFFRGIDWLELYNFRLVSPL